MKIVHAVSMVLCAALIFVSIAWVDRQNTIKHIEPNILSKGRGYNVR